MITTFGLAFVAGALTMLSPCVIPVIPLVMAGASKAARFGPTFLLVGLITSFTLTGTFATAILFQLELSPDLLSDVGGAILVVVGSFLLFPGLDKVFKRLSTGPANHLSGFVDGLSIDGRAGQFVLGLVIGVIWAPCTGPTLGAAIALASQQEQLIKSFFTMLSFSIGATIPLALFGATANRFLQKRGLLVKYGARARIAMGVLFVGIGTAILTSFHKTVEATVLQILPEWWVNLITSI